MPYLIYAVRQVEWEITSRTPTVETVITLVIIPKWNKTRIRKSSPQSMPCVIEVVRQVEQKTTSWTPTINGNCITDMMYTGNDISRVLYD